jgi:hypothetical protein
VLPIRAWRVFYADGSTFDSTQGTWAEGPPFGVQCVVWYHDPPYKTLDQGVDVYVHEGEGGVKMGLFVDEEGYRRVQDLAMRSTLPEV